MKKSLIIIIAVLMLLSVCLCACNDHSSEMRDINILLRKEYSKMDVTVSSTYSGYSLEDSYKFVTENSQTNIEYTITRLNSFDTSNGAVVAPDEMTTKYQGSAVVKDGQLISVKGEPITPAQLESLSITNMSFKLPYFNNINTPKNTFSADVVNAKDFLGNENFDGTEMHVVVRYTDTGIYRITLTYMGVGECSVSVTYVLSK